MLKPDYLDTVADRLVELWSEAELAILEDMARRITTYDYYIPAAQWQKLKLQEMNKTHYQIQTELSKITGLTYEELDRLFIESGRETLKYDDNIYRSVGLSVSDITMSDELTSILNAGAKRTKNTFLNLTSTTARQGAQQFIESLDNIWMQVNTGAFTRETATQMAIKQLAKDGITTVKYPTGHRDTIETAVRRAAITGINQTAAQLQLERMKEMGCTLVEVSAHAGARPDHMAWQGKVYSLEGKTDKYDNFYDATGYGTGPGLCGWNCRHNFRPYFEGSPLTYSDDLLEEYKNETVTYDGKTMTEYDARQRQRYIERNIRAWKRDFVTSRGAGLDTYKSAEKIKYWQDKEKDFLAQTGLKKQSGRSQIGEHGKVEVAQVRAINKEAKK